MCRRLRVPPTRGHLCRTLPPPLPWAPGADCRLRALVSAVAWGRRPGSSVSRDAEATPQRTRLHTCFLVQRGEPAAARRRHAQARRRARRPGKGKLLHWSSEAAKHAKR